VSERLRVACVGTTHPHASARVRALRKLPAVEVIAAADEHAGLESFCAAYGLEPSSHEEVLADGTIDAILVHSESNHMASDAIAGLHAGKAVLVEKPGGATVADIESLAEEVERTGGIVQVGNNCRLADSVRTAGRWLAAGVVGDVVTVNAHGAARVGEHLSAHLNQPADMGGGLWVIGCHVLDVVLALCGMPLAVSARVAKFHRLSDARSREDAAAVVLSYDHHLAVYDFSVHDDLEWFETSRVTLSCTKGVVEIGLLPQTLRVHLTEAVDGFPAGWSSWRSTQFATPWAKGEASEFSELPELSNLDFFHVEARDFVRAVREGAPPSVTVNDALNVARVISACYESEQAGGASIRVAASSHADSTRSVAPTGAQPGFRPTP
jgi:predicted dehydrogenase